MAKARQTVEMAAGYAPITYLHSGTCGSAQFLDHTRSIHAAERSGLGSHEQNKSRFDQSTSGSPGRMASVSRPPLVVITLSHHIPGSWLQSPAEHSQPPDLMSGKPQSLAPCESSCQAAMMRESLSPRRLIVSRRVDKPPSTWRIPQTLTRIRHPHGDDQALAAVGFPIPITVTANRSPADVAPAIIRMERISRCASLTTRSK